MYSRGILKIKDTALSIKRAPRPKSNFTIIQNSVLRDENLSFRARGVLACILSRPDNWNTTADNLARESKEGRNAILTVLKELEDAGYMTRKKYRNDKGQWLWESFVFDTPQTKNYNPEFRNPPMDDPNSGEPSTEIQTLIEELNKNKRKEEIYTRTFESEVIDACNYLADRIEDNGSKRPEVTDRWLMDMQRIHKLDERTWDEINAAIRWSQDDEFWRANILSPGKLRKQYDRMRLQAVRDQKKSKFTQALNWLEDINWNDQKEIEK